MRQLHEVGVTVLLLAVVLTAGCQQRMPPSPRAEIALGQRPDSIDRSLLDDVRLSIDGVDALSDTPIVTAGSEAHFTGLIVPKDGVLKPGQTLLFLVVRHHKVGDVGAQWDKPDPAQEWALHSGKNKIDQKQTIKLEPGEYELRYYVMRDNFLDLNELPGVYYLGRGKLNVVPVSKTPATDAH